MAGHLIQTQLGPTFWRLRLLFANSPESHTHFCDCAKEKSTKKIPPFLLLLRLDDGLDCGDGHVFLLAIFTRVDWPLRRQIRACVGGGRRGHVLGGWGRVIGWDALGLVMRGVHLARDTMVCAEHMWLTAGSINQSEKNKKKKKNQNWPNKNRIFTLILHTDTHTH